MEKRFRSLKNLFSDLCLRDMVERIMSIARHYKDDVDVFRRTGNGCVLLMAVPLCPVADEWLGGLTTYEDGKKVDAHEYIAARTIAPGGSHTIQWTDPDDQENHHTEPVNCLAYATMKLAYLSHLLKDDVIDRDHEKSSFDEKYYCEANGYSRHRGATCVTIDYGDRAIMRLYIVFSGATEDEDLYCSLNTAIRFCACLTGLYPLLRFTYRTVDGIAYDDATDKLLGKVNFSPSKVEHPSNQ